MESLTKENFWNALTEKYPDQMKQFGEWIDKYKSKNDWNNLFKSGFVDKSSSQGGPYFIEAPKYHELPIAMQIGIFIQFTSESNWKYSFSVEDNPYIDEFPVWIKRYFEENS